LAYANQLPLPRLYTALLVTSLTHVSGAVTSVQTFTFTYQLLLGTQLRLNTKGWLRLSRPGC